MDKLKEEEKLLLFYDWLIKNNPSIATCVDLMKAIDKFITYKLTTLKHLEDSKVAMDYGFAEMIKFNFPDQV